MHSTNKGLPLLLTVVVACLFAGSLQSLHGDTRQEGTTLTVKLEYHAVKLPVPFISASLNEKEIGYFVLDSGTNLPLIIDQQIAEKLNLEYAPEQKNVNEKKSIRIAKKVRLQIAIRLPDGSEDTLTLNLKNIGVADLSGLKRAVHPSVIAVLGTMLLQKFPCQFNLDAQTLELYVEGKKPPVPLDALTFPYQEQDSTLYIQLNLGGKLQKFLLDTGSTSTQITPELAQSINAIPIQGASLSVVSEGQKQSAMVALPEWKWQEIVFKPVLLYVAKDEPALGMDILQKFNIIFDTQNKKIHLVPRKNQTSMAISPAMPLIEVEKEKKNVVIRGVIPNSNAAENGLRAGDIVLSIDETPIENLSIERVQRLIYGQVGVEAKVVIQRNNEFKTLTYKRYPLTLFAAPSRFGLQVELSKKGDLEVFLAKKGSVAERLGVKAGDQIVAVNDINSPIERMLEQFEGDQKTIKMTLKRKETGKTESVILSLVAL